LGLKLVEAGVLTIETLVARMTVGPARILGLECGVRVGLPADLTLIDPRETFTVEAARFESKSRNTPFDGMQLKGRAVMTMVGGKVVYNRKND
jgi:dihydroorotase